MSTEQSLHAIWEASAKTPFFPNVGKDAQFLVGFVLLLGAFVLTSLFGLNNSLKNIPILAVPASLAFGFGAVYMICAVGVYCKLYRPRRQSASRPAKWKFHPVTSTLLIFGCGLVSFFVFFAIAVKLSQLIF